MPTFGIIDNEKISYTFIFDDRVSDKSFRAVWVSKIG